MQIQDVYGLKIRACASFQIGPHIVSMSTIFPIVSVCVAINGDWNKTKDFPTVATAVMWAIQDTAK